MKLFDVFLLKILTKLMNLINKKDICKVKCQNSQTLMDLLF